MYQLWMSRPGPKSEGMDENRVEYRYPVHFQQQHSVQTTSTYVLKYRVMYTVQIHTFILRTFAIICICNCTYKYLMQGSQDPNWNKRHQYRGRLIPLSSVLDPWLHADFRPVRQGSGVALLHKCFCASGINAVTGVREGKNDCCFHQLPHYIYRRCPMQSLGISRRTIT